MDIKNVLVTGAAGYIGTVLVEKLLSSGFTTRGMDALFYEACLGGWRWRKGIERKDIRSISLPDLQGIDAIVHLAALSNDPIGALDESLTYEINYKETVRLAKLAKAAGVKVFLFSSSCSVYGKSDTEWVTESSAVVPLTAYAKSKRQSEIELSALADSSFSVYLLRNSTVYGFSPCFRDDLVVNNFTVHGFTKGNIEIHSDGTPWRPLIDVRDLSSIIVRFLKELPQFCNGEIVNIGFPENNVQVRDILNLVHGALPMCEIIYTGKHGADTRSYRVKFDKLLSIFPNLRQEWTLDYSIRDLVQRLPYFYSNEDSDTGLFTRLSVLKKLQDERRVNNNLYWRYLQPFGDVIFSKNIAYA